MWWSGGWSWGRIPCDLSYYVGRLCLPGLLFRLAKCLAYQVMVVLRLYCAGLAVVCPPLAGRLGDRGGAVVYLVNSCPSLAAALFTTFASVPLLVVQVERILQGLVVATGRGFCLDAGQ